MAADYGLQYVTSNAPLELLSRYTHVDRGGVNILYIMQDLLYTVQNIISGIASISPYSHNDGYLSTKYEISVGQGRPTVTLQYQEFVGQENVVAADNGVTVFENLAKNGPSFESLNEHSRQDIGENERSNETVVSVDDGETANDVDEDVVEEIEVVPDFDACTGKSEERTEIRTDGTFLRSPHRLGNLIRKQALKTTLFQRKPRPRAKLKRNVAVPRSQMPADCDQQDPGVEAKNCLACTNETELRAEMSSEDPQNSYGYVANAENVEQQEVRNEHTTAQTGLFGNADIAQSIAAILNKKTSVKSIVKLKRYPCKYCSKSFNTPSKKETHERVHTGEKPFACRYCNAFFTQLGSKRRHEQRHKQNSGGKAHAWCSCKECTDQKLKRTSNESTDEEVQRS